MTSNIHYFYDKLTNHERNFVDQQIDLIFKSAKNFGVTTEDRIDLIGDDRCERFSDEFARWVIESRQ